MRLWTDFNYMEDEDRLWATLDKAESYFKEELRVGQRAELFDGLGYECVGYITSMDLANDRVQLRPDWTTWRSTRRPSREFDYLKGHDARFANATVKVESVA
jgi:hypothetical protein